MAQTVTSYGSIGASQPLNPSLTQIDPTVLARVIQVVASQMAATQNTQQAPAIAQVTEQHTLLLPDGQYVGDVQDDLPHGRGTLTYHPGQERKKYEGEWQNGQFHGNGVLKMSNEARYEGQWKNGMLHGQGIIFSADGGKYEGNFDYGDRSGRGTQRHADGDTYVGEWKGNKAHGQGTYTFSSGAKYVGGFKNNKSHGRGTYTSADEDGTDYTGAWKDDKKHGQGLESDGFCTRKGIFREGSLWTGTVNITGGSDTEYRDGQKVSSCCLIQ